MSFWQTRNQTFLFYKVGSTDSFCSPWKCSHGNYLYWGKKDLVYPPPPPAHTHTHTVHMALMGYFIVFSFVTKPGQTLEFLLWGTIVPLNFLAGYYCSIVASTPQPTVYAFMYTHTRFNVKRESRLWSISDLNLCSCFLEYWQHFRRNNFSGCLKLFKLLDNSSLSLFSVYVWRKKT